MVAKGRQPLNPVPLYDEAEHRAFLEGMGLRTDLAERHSVTIRKHALFTLLQSNGDPAKVDVASVEKVPKVAKGAAALERFSPLTSTVVHEDWNAKGIARARASGALLSPPLPPRSLLQGGTR